MGTLNLRVQFTLYFLVGSTLLFQHASAVCNGGDSCCDGIKCGLGEGDCDSDTSCEGSLKCGTDNCFGENFDESDDCCYDPLPSPTTTQKPNPVTDTVIDCKAMEDAQLIIRNTRIASGCDIGNPTISLNTCSQISCLEDIAKKSGACARESEKMDCQSLEKMSAAFLAVSKQYCDGQLASFGSSFITEAGDQTIPWSFGMDPAELCATPGTKVTFDWTLGHTLQEVQADSFESVCNKVEAQSPAAGPKTWTAPSVLGVNFFACGVPGHCSSGMRAKIEVKSICP